MEIEMKPDIAWIDGEKVIEGERFVVGFLEGREYGLELRDLKDYGEDDGFSCDLFFRNPEFEEHDAFGYIWQEDSQLDCTRFATPQEAVDYALGSLAGTIMWFEQSGYLRLDGNNGSSMTITASPLQ